MNTNRWQRLTDSQRDIISFLAGGLTGGAGAIAVFYLAYLLWPSVMTSPAGIFTGFILCFFLTCGGMVLGLTALDRFGDHRSES